MKTKGRIISLLICFCMLMQFVTTVAFASSANYTIYLNPNYVSNPGDKIMYFNVQNNVSNGDEEFSLKYNSDFYDNSGDIRNTPYISYRDTTTGEVITVEQESSPLKYKSTTDGEAYILEIVTPETLINGHKYYTTVMTFPPKGKQVDPSVIPMAFIIENLIVVAKPSSGGGGGGSAGGVVDTSIFSTGVSNGMMTIMKCNSTASGDIVIPEYIKGEPVEGIAARAFMDRSEITSIEIPKTMKVIGEYAFFGCHGLTDVVIPESVTSLYGNAFGNCINLEDVTILGEIETINMQTFASCSKLTSITLPASVKYIYDRAFMNCKALKDVYYSGTKEEWANVWFGVGNDPIKNATIHFEGEPEPTPTPTPEPEEPSIYEYSIYNGKVTITRCDYDATGKIEIPSTIEGYPVTEIGTDSFCKCNDITSVIIPDGVTDIGDYAFYGCSNMEEITIPRSLAKIGNKAFTNCEALTDVYYGGTKEEWESMSIGTSNDAVYNATVHYLDEPDEPEEPTPTPTPEPEEPDVPAEDIITFNIADTTDLSPVSGAQVIIVSADESMGTETKSDENGVAKTSVPDGIYTVQVMAQGYDVRTFTVEKTEEKDEFTVYLNKNPLVKIETSAKEMTKQEMIDAGIDIDAEDNKHIYKCTTVLKFVPVASGGSIDITPIEINFDYVYDEKGTIIVADPVYQGGRIIYPVAKDIYLIVHSETTWLKEMFDVQLVVANTSVIEKIKDCEINLDLPEGLSLATMVDGEQSLTVAIDEIAPQDAKDIHWYVRGDDAGEYIIGGSLEATRTGGGIKENFEASFAMQDPITVLAGGAMKLVIEAEKFATAGKPYKMRYSLHNVSSKTLYDVSLNVLGGKFCKAYDVKELIHNGELVDYENLGGTFNKGVELIDEEFKSGEMMVGVFEITFGQGITTDYIEYMVAEMFTVTGAGSTTTIPTKVLLVDSIESHMYGEGKITKEPTCTEGGVIEYSCTLCGGGKFSASMPEKNHAVGSWIISREPTCTGAGEKYRKCADCDYTETVEIAKLAHKYEFEVTKEPTTTEEGVMTYSCEACGTTKTAVIPVCKRGDLVGDDEKVDAKDVIALRRFITGGYGIMAYIAAADVTKDGVVDVRDVIVIRRYIAGGYGVTLDK